MDELTTEVQKRIEGSQFSFPLPLVDPEGRGRELGNNIELWMTYLSQQQPWLEESSNQYNRALATELRNQIARTIVERTSNSMGVGGPPPDWLKLLIELWSERAVTVITLNYDTLVERLAITIKSRHRNEGERSRYRQEREKSWYRNEGDGLSLSQLYPRLLTNIRSRVETLVSMDPVHTFLYLKLHGSVNWHYSGRDNFYGETIFYSDVSPWGGAIDRPEFLSMHSAIDKETLIIPPVTEKTNFFNNETIKSVWQQASGRLERASRVFVIGYSLPISDLGMQFFLKRSLPAEETEWFIVDTDKDVIGRYRKLLEPQQKVRDDFVGPDSVLKFSEEYPSLD